jgi:hypothetical protein
LGERAVGEEKARQENAGKENAGPSPLKRFGMTNTSGNVQKTSRAMRKKLSVTNFG